MGSLRRFSFVPADPTSCLVSTAIDLGRIRPRNQIPEVGLVRLLLLGRVTDLLENMRRTEEKDELTLEIVTIQASAIGLDPALAQNLVKNRLVNDKLVHIDGEEITLLYGKPSDVYGYSIRHMLSELSEAELSLLKLICNSTRKAMGIEDLDKVLGLFLRAYRQGLRTFLFDNKILQEFRHDEADYIVSPRAYKNEKNFKMAIEVLTDHKLSPLMDFIRENPGNPDTVVQTYKNVDRDAITALSSSGVIDPLALDVHGDKKNYLFSADLLRKRSDNDHFDLVKTTLANFRFGEYYSTNARLSSLEKFLQSLLDRGFAGAATPIGTDYNELESRQIVRVKAVSGTEKYRFWLLKRDVIEDCLSVLKGYVPINAQAMKPNLSGIDSVVQSRSDLNIISATKSTVADAIRMIQEGIGFG